MCKGQEEIIHRQNTQMAIKYVKTFYLIREQRNINKNKNEVLVFKPSNEQWFLWKSIMGNAEKVSWALLKAPLWSGQLSEGNFTVCSKSLKQSLRFDLARFPQGLQKLGKASCMFIAALHGNALKPNYLTTTLKGNMHALRIISANRF